MQTPPAQLEADLFVKFSAELPSSSINSNCVIIRDLLLLLMGLDRRKELLTLNLELELDCWFNDMTNFPLLLKLKVVPQPSNMSKKMRRVYLAYFISFI